MTHKSRRTETHQPKQAAVRTASRQAASMLSAAAEIASASNGAWASLRLSRTDDERIAQEYVARGWVDSQADILQTLSASQRGNLKRLAEKAHPDQPASAWASLPVTKAETH